MVKELRYEKELKLTGDAIKDFDDILSEVILLGKNGKVIRIFINNKKFK